MKKFFTENKFYILLLIAVILLITQKVFAQPGPPGPPVGIVPWGSPFIYSGIVLGAGLLFLIRNKRHQNK